MNLGFEKRYWKKGLKFIAGVDEVGRGALAGPVLAVAVLVLKDFEKEKGAKDFIKKVKDSKALKPKEREEIYKELLEFNFIFWGEGRVYPKLIDKINIFQATKLAMKRALNNLKQRASKEIENFDFDLIVLDGKINLDLKRPQISIVKADSKIFSCALASIIAKIKRDKYMERLNLKLPFYNFSKNKGYPTSVHLGSLKEKGISKFHRKTFLPCKIYLNKTQQ